MICFLLVEKRFSVLLTSPLVGEGRTGKLSFTSPLVGEVALKGRVRGYS